MEHRRRGERSAGEGAFARVAAPALALLALTLLGGCNTTGDFGRVRSSLVPDNIHAWVGRKAAAANGDPVSQFPLTDDERTLRDLAYPLIEPPYDRQRWYSVLGEYGLLGHLGPTEYVTTAYAAHLVSEPVRSANTRYTRLIDDVRNDVERIDPFFAMARRVIDIDGKRHKSMAYIPSLSGPERGDALARINENALVIAWVHRSLTERAAAYRFALERLVVGTPAPAAADAERAITLMTTRIAQYPLVEGPPLGGPYAAPPSGRPLVSK
jgi:hypothetical protein